MLITDSRPIRSVVLANTWHKVGHDEVTAITVTEENGQMATVAWFEVWKGKRLLCRSNSAHVSEVYYEEGA